MSFNVITTVVTPAAGALLTQLATVKDELDLADGKADQRLGRYIAEASAAALQYCNRRAFQVETIQDEIYPANDPHPRQLTGSFEILQLSSWPIVAVASVVEDGTTLVENSDFKVRRESGALIRLDAAGHQTLWTARPKIVQFQAGFAGLTGFGGIPAEVEGAVIRMVTRRYTAPKDPNLRQQNIPGVLEQSWWIASGSETGGNMSPDITDLLDNYRVPVTA